MKSSRISTALLLTAGLVLAPPSAAAVNAYLQLGDVKGESKDPVHHDWIEVLSTNFKSAPAGRSAENVNHGSFNIVKLVDKSSPALSMAASSRKPFPRVTIEARGSRWVLTNVIVSSVVPHFSSASGEENPTESVTFEYGGLEIAYEHQTTGTPTPSKKSPSAAEVAPPALQAAVAPPKITGASASAPVIGTSVTVTVTSTGPCTSAFVDYGDGSISEGHTLTGTSTQIPAHAYASAGVKTIKVGGRDAPYWTSSKKGMPTHPNDCTGWAPEVKVTLRSGAIAAPLVR